MYKALYNFTATEKQCLSLTHSEKVTLIDRSNPDWWEVTNDRGVVGFVPSTYLEKDEAPDDDVLLSIDRAIESIHLQATCSGVYTSSQREHLVKLVQHRQGVGPHSGRRKTSAANQSVPGSKFTKASKSTKSNATPNLSHSLSGSSFDSLHSSQSYSSSVGSRRSHSVIPKLLGPDLVELLRSSTNLSYDKSCSAIAAIVTHLRDNVISVSREMDDILETLLQNDNGPMEMSGDHRRLRHLLKELTICKDDSQQRSWALHEDQKIISDNLKELTTILTDANPAICKSVIQYDDYDSVNSLILYYQMEIRASIRLLLLQTFTAICGVDRDVIAVLLCSVLPLEIARDIQNQSTDMQKVYMSALVLSLLFSTGESIPVPHYEHLNTGFVSYLLSLIETPPESDDDERIPDLFTEVLLAFNLHFQIPDQNLIMRTLGCSSTTRAFSERILVLFNREEDPVGTLCAHSYKSNSILKMMEDILSCSRTAEIFYTNDLKVVIDIVIRQATDITPGRQTRTQYLSLMHLILHNTTYSEHRHRQQDLKQLFDRIINEDPVQEQDQLIVGQIYKDSPQFFP